MAKVDPKTVKAAREGKQGLRPATKRALLDALNLLLIKAEQKKVGYEIFN